MANKVVKDSGLSIFVKEIAVPEATEINALVRVGAKAGLAGNKPYEGEDGNFYVTVDTAALVRVTSAVAFTDGQTAYMTSTGTVVTTATGNVAIGYADRAKVTGAGDLWLQLVPLSNTTAGA